MTAPSANAPMRLSLNRGAAKERNVKIVDIDRVVDQLLDRVFLPCRQVLAPLCDHGGEQVPARIVFLHPDRGVAGVGLAEQ